MTDHPTTGTENLPGAVAGHPPPPPEPPVPVRLPEGWGRAALIAGAAALVLAAVLGALVSPAAFFRAYLPAYLFVLGLSLGSLALAMISYMTGGGWGRILTPVFGSATALLPLLAVLFLPLLLPVLLRNDWLYPWADANIMKSQPEVGKLVQAKEGYLNPAFFVARAAVYFVVWLGVSWVFWGKVRKFERTGDLEDDRAMRTFSAVGLAAYGLTITFAAVDWGMSLEPEWFSTIYGVLLAVGELLAGFGFAVFVTLAVVVRAGRPCPERMMRDFGNLMLAFTMLWAYMAFAQFLLIYSGNLTEEIPWYLKRTHNGWQYVFLLMAVCQFGVPFFALLTDDVKLNPSRLMAVAGLVVAMRLVDLVWFILPAFRTDTEYLWWMTPLTEVGLIGVWGGLFLRSLAPRSFNLRPFPVEEEAAHA